MTHFIRNTQVKAMTSIWTAKQKARELAGRTKEALVNREGQGTLDVAITVLISIVDVYKRQDLHDCQGYI